jgi:hypothetical protein
MFICLFGFHISDHWTRSHLEDSALYDVIFEGTSASSDGLNIEWEHSSYICRHFLADPTTVCPFALLLSMDKRTFMGS